MTPSGVLPVLYCSQYDIGRPLGMVVYSGGESVDLSTYTCTIEATRTDGTAITAAVTTDGNIGAFVTTATMTNKVDKYPAKLVLFDSQSRRVASLAFIMCITPATMDENAESIEEDKSLYQQYTEVVQAAIAEIRTDIADLKERVAKNTSAIQNLPKWMHGNIILDAILPRDYTLQGACSVGGNRIVAYFASDTSDTGMLRCYNYSTYTLVWEHAIKGYHGNSVCYRKNDNCVYICGCYSVADDTTLINKVVVVDLSAPSVVKAEISAPSQLYSIAYDASTDTFYSINYRGTESGYANRLCEYNGTFESVKRSVDLEDSLPVIYGRSTQGLAFAKDGIVYTLGYDDQARYVVGNYVIDGKTAIIAHVPSMVNGYRYTGEVQNLAYDESNDAWIIGAYAKNSGVHGKGLNFFFEVDLYHGIVEYMTDPLNPSYSYGTMSNGRVILNVANGSENLAPFQKVNAGVYKCVTDAVNVATRLGAYAYINLSEQYGGILEIGNINLSNFKGRISSGVSGKKVDIYSVYASGNSDITFLGCRFVSSEVIASHQANIIVRNNNTVSFDDCAFNDFETGDGVTTKAHVFAYEYGTVRFAANNTFGTLTHVTSVYYGKVIERLMYDWTRLEGKFSSVANTYVYTGLSLTVPSNRFYRVWMDTNYGSAEPTGIGIASSSSVFNNSSIIFILEKNERPARHTPEYILLPGTYYMWVRKAAASSNESAYLYYREDVIGV